MSEGCTSNQTNIDKIEERLYEQEHRGFAVFKNLICSLFVTKKYKWACTKAVLFYLAPTGSRTILISGGAVLGFFTLALMQKNNELLQEQNYFFKQQVYAQTKNERDRAKSELLKILYEETDASLAQSNSWARTNKILPKPKRVPRHSISARQDAFDRLVHWEEIQLREPVKENKENIAETVSRAYCESIEWNCEQKPENKKKNLNKLAWTDYNVHVRHGFFEGLNLELVWSNTSYHDNLNDNLNDNKNHIDFRVDNGNFDRAIFKGYFFGDIKGSSVKNADLQGISWADSGLNNVDFTKSNMKGANFREAHFENSIFKHSNLQDTNLTDLRARGANFQSANLMNSNLFGADFSNTNLVGTDFRNASFGRFNIDNADVSLANFTATNKSIFRKSGMNHADEYHPLTCEILMKAKNWRKAITDLNCASNIFEEKQDNLKQ